MAGGNEGQLELAVTRGDRAAESRRVMRQLRRDAQRIAAHFGLRYASLRPEREGITDHFGICYANGEIRVRLRHATTGRVLRYSSLIDTVCHELAHLRHFDHSERFEAFFAELLEWARAEGIYRPRVLPASRGKAVPSLCEPRAARQLPLFGDPRLRRIIAR